MRTRLWKYEPWKDMSASDLRKELEARLTHLYGRTDGSYEVPDNCEGDVISLVISMLVAENPQDPRRITNDPHSELYHKHPLVWSTRLDAFSFKAVYTGVGALNAVYVVRFEPGERNYATVRAGNDLTLIHAYGIPPNADNAYCLFCSAAKNIAELHYDKWLNERKDLLQVEEQHDNLH